MRDEIKKIDDYVSIRQILDEEIASGYPGTKHIYKMKLSEDKEKIPKNIDSQSKNLDSEMVDIDNKFVSIKIK